MLARDLARSGQIDGKVERHPGGSYASGQNQIAR